MCLCPAAFACYPHPHKHTTDLYPLISPTPTTTFVGYCRYRLPHPSLPLCRHLPPFYLGLIPHPCCVSYCVNRAPHLRYAFVTVCRTLIPTVLFILFVFVDSLVETDDAHIIAMPVPQRCSLHLRVQISFIVILFTFSSVRLVGLRDGFFAPVHFYFPAYAFCALTFTIVFMRALTFWLRKTKTHAHSPPPPFTWFLCLL